MKPFILPDYFDGTKETNNINLRYLCWMVQQLSIACHLNEYSQIVGDLDKIVHNRDRERVQLEFTDEVKKFSFNQIMLSYLNYKLNPVNYVVSRPLAECLKDTNINVKSKYLPDKFSAYFEIPNVKDDTGFIIEGFFCNILYNKNNEKMFHAIAISKSGVQYSTCYVGFILNRETSIEEELDNIERNKIKGERGRGTIPKEAVILLLNLIIYITSKNADIVLEKNEFSQKKSKRDAQLKQFTAKNWVMLGRNFHTKNLPRGPLDCGAFEVRGHYRWQVCGKGRLDRELIFIDPFMKGLTK